MIRVNCTIVRYYHHHKVYKRKMQILLLAIVGVTIYCAFYQITYRQKNLQQLGDESQLFEENHTNESLLEVDVFDFCPFEVLDPWHKSVVKFIDVKYGFDTKCDGKPMSKPVTTLRKNRIVLTDSSTQYDCKGRCVSHINNNKYNVSDWVSIQNNTFHCDFVETLCTNGDATRKFLHMQIEEKDSRSNGFQISRKANPDVHVLVLDSIASSQFIRALPRTVNFLVHGLSAVEFRKFNKVGSNSRPNAFPALLGKTTEDVERKVMNLDTIAADLSYEKFCESYLDNETYIPTEYQKAGYRTLDADDYVTSVLRYPNCRGMRNDNLDHYYRAFHRRLEEGKTLRAELYDRQCRGSFDYMLDYLSLFLNAYKDTPKFSFLWNVEMAHDNSQNLYKADFTLYNFFLKNRDALSNSFIFFFGDHGLRFGKEAYTSLGEEERNNPFLYVVVPKSVRKTSLYQQLVRNSEELVTHHDLYATLLDILHYQPASNFTDISFKSFRPARGSSLLRRFEPGKPRNCKTLPIPFQYCICQFVKEKVTDKILLSMLGDFVSSQLQSHLNSQNVSTQCERIKVLKTEAQQYITTGPNATLVTVTSPKIFDVTFEVSRPAMGKFQIPVRKVGEDLQIAGERFTRLDKYGKNGDCMKNDLLRPLCTCKRGEPEPTSPPTSKKSRETTSPSTSAKSTNTISTPTTIKSSLLQRTSSL